MWSVCLSALMCGSHRVNVGSGWGEVGSEIHVLLQYLIKIVTQCNSNTVSFSY